MEGRGTLRCDFESAQSKASERSSHTLDFDDDGGDCLVKVVVHSLAPHISNYSARLRALATWAAFSLTGCWYDLRLGSS